MSGPLISHYKFSAWICGKVVTKKAWCCDVHEKVCMSPSLQSVLIYFAMALCCYSTHGFCCRIATPWLCLLVCHTAALLSRFSHALTEHFNGAIIEFNKRFDGARVMSEEVERGTLKVVPIFKTEMEESQSEIVQVLKQQLTPTIMQQLAPSAVAFAASSGLLSPSFDFSQVGHSVFLVYRVCGHLVHHFA